MDSLVIDKRKHLLSLALIAVLISVTFYLLLRNHDLPELLALLRQTNMLYILLGVLAIVLFFGFEALSIKSLLGSLGYRPRYIRCLSYALIDFYFSSITPGSCGGQPAQIYYMQRDGVEIGASSLALLIFNMSYHLSVLLVAGLALLIGGGQLLVDVGAIKYFLIYGVAAQLLIGSLYMLAIFSRRLMPTLVRVVIGLLARMRIIRNRERALDKVAVQINEYQRGAAYIRRRPQILLLTLALTIAHVIALYSLPFWIYKAFGLTGVGFWSIIAIQAALTLSLESLPIPGDIGVAEGSYLLIYGGIFGAALAVPAMLLMRGLNYYAGLIVGGLTAAIAHSRKKVHVSHIFQHGRTGKVNM